MKDYISVSIMLLMSIFLSPGAIAQKTVKEIGVKGINAENYIYPFAGGMNACQFGEIDINMDGIKDLIAFDRQGNRLMPFINHGTPNTVDYTWEPQYIEEFPDIYAWVILADYNMDGKADIFTYNPAWPGIIVYKNISTYELRFERVVYPFLTSWYGSGYVNILVTYADYPGISDLDGDGDLDILTFIAVGSFVEMHKNLSMETYGHADSLIFEHTTWCWGYFAESEESNDLFLDTCYGSKDYNSEHAPVRDRHTGSTFLLTDLDNDQDKDLLLGDVDYPTLIYMLNGGDQQEAVITFYDPAFPHENDQIRVFSMPVAALIDVNNDGVRDLLVSPFDPNPFISMNLSSVWYYSNDGSNEYPDFNLKNKRFLQENMIDAGSGAYPVFADINLDGLYDLIIGNYGYYKSSWYENYVLHSDYASQISLFMNSGEAEKPQFEYETADFGFIGEMNLRGAYPALGDIDTDDDADMIVGRDDGTLMFYRNCSCLGNPEDFELEEVNYQGIDVGDYSTPFLYDIDEDGLIDLIIGERGGNLNYYKNTGDLYNPEFTLVTDSLGKVLVTDFNLSWDGYSTPYVFRANDGKMRLISGSEQGIIYYYTDIEGNLEGSFTPADDLWKLIDSIEFNILPGYRTSAAIADIDLDGYLDLAVGNFSGGLNLYSTNIEPPVTMDIPQNNTYDQLRLQIFPNPANDHISVKTGLAGHSGPFIIQLYNMNGVKVFEDDFQENVNSTINVGNLANGIYLCVIRSAADYKPIASGKFIIER